MKHLLVVVILLSSLATFSQQTGDLISWQIPTDGGTPRDPSRITKIGENHFRINATLEEGGTSVLKHAVSRMDIICNNSGTKPITITLEIDISQDGTRTDYDTKPEGGMKFRDFIFVRQAGQKWKQITGHTKGWVSIIKFQVQPGATQVGLSPWYTYADYLSFIASLKEGPLLSKRMLTNSNGGRQHWEIVITDPTVSGDKKETIFWHAREHAYESFSSYAMEGLIPFLLSDKAKDFRQRYTIILHPMTNVDGVADGYEYRVGYDFPKSRETETAKITFGAVDRLKPQYAVAWHNWISPRDRNVVFFTDGEEGVPTPRAWLRFTQLFPSLRKWEHRWKDENNPARYNWQNRVVGDHNVHQYAMKNYATSIWGWEMPWWNLTEDEARQAGADFAFAYLTTLSELKSKSVAAPKQRERVEVAQFGMHQFDVTAKSNVDNPFRDAMLVGEFTSPSGKKHVIDGFFDGGDRWKLRFSPDEQGEWTYQLRGEGIDALEQGAFACTAAIGHGRIGIHPDNPYSFAHQDGTPFFPMGDTNYGLFDDTPITQAVKTAYLEKRRSQNFNFVRMEVGHSHEHAKADPSYWAWGGSPAQPDLDRFNPDYFRKFDSLMFQMQKVGMNSELILLNFYRLPFTDTTQWTHRRERQWIRYLISRYGAFDNLFMWTISNEYETHPEGKYWLDSVADVSWAKRTSAYIRQSDAGRHLVTVHPVVSSSTSGGNPRAPFELPWRIGGFFGTDSTINVLSHQTGQSGTGVLWDKTCECWMGDDPQLTASVLKDRVYKKPVINTENGYEYLRGQPTMRGQVHHTDKVRRSSWRIVCSGGYFAAGFSGTIGHNDIWNVIDKPNKYTFQLKDEGGGQQLSYLYQFFKPLRFWKMEPYQKVLGDVVALADQEQRTVVIYFTKGGTAIFEWPELYEWEAQWFDPRNGKFVKTEKLKALKSISLKAPGKDDWVLLMKTR